MKQPKPGFFQGMNRFVGNNGNALMLGGIAGLMSQNPDRAWSNFAQGFGMGNMMDQQRRQTAKSNKTLEFMTKQWGMDPMEAQMLLDNGGFQGEYARRQKEARTAKTSYMTVNAIKARHPDMSDDEIMGVIQTGQAGEYLKPEEQKSTALMQNYEYAKQNGFNGSIMDYQLALKKAGATNVNVGNGSPGLGKLSTDFGYVLDPATGQPRIDQETGLPQAAAVPGSPAALKQQQAEQAAQVKQQSTARSGNVVLEDIDRALAGMNQDTLPTTGPVGGALSNVPGTQAFDVAKLIETVKANAGFDKLQAMRDASPTGGALGQVSEREIAFLQAAIGNLSQSQSREQLEYNLKRVRRIYDEIINGPNGGSSQQQPQQSAPQDQSVVDYSEYF